MTGILAILRLAVCGLSLLKVALAGGPDGLNQEYCSTENTGSDGESSTFHWQSNGRCFNQCQGSYAFAVVQNWTCWCSNYIPAAQQDVGSCSQQCPGFQADLCGNGAEGLYGYIPIPSKTPSGTAGAVLSSSTATSATPDSTTAPTSTIQPSTTAAPTSTDDGFTSSSDAPTSYTSSDDPSTTPSTPTSSTLLSLSTSVTPVPATLLSTTSVAESSSRTITATPSPMTSVRVITISGAIVTQTVTSTPMVFPSSLSDISQKRHLSGGAIAGIVIGSIFGVAALAFGAFLLWSRKSRDAQDGKPRRTTSVLSRTGLVSRVRPQSMAEYNHNEEYVHAGTGQNSTRHSMFFGAGAAGEGDGVSPVSPLGSSHDTNEALYGRSNNKSRVHDQRLNPSAIFANQSANGSRVSMQDQNDYSRPLGVTNPDLRPSTDSRSTRP